MPGACLYLAKPNVIPTAAVSVTDVVRTMLDARLAAVASVPDFISQAAAILRRALGFDVSGAFWVAPEHPTALTLTAAEGLPPEFADVARSVSLPDYEQVADLPYNDAHGSCYGDFFASVVGTFGIRSWLVASLIVPGTQDIIGAILLGTRAGNRFDSAETQLVQSLAAPISACVNNSRTQENDHGLASLDAAA